MHYIYIILFIISLFCLGITILVLSKSIYIARMRTVKVKETLNERESFEVTQTVNMMESKNIVVGLQNINTDKIIASTFFFPCIVGRSDMADIEIKNDLYISKRHMIITCENENIYIEDLHSTNGTYINGSLLLNKQRVDAGDIICIGETIVRLIVNGKSDASISPLYE